ncbi:hypothetical protein EYF80_022135 [Liparis tanakae]|uniref:Uncharacterized protein n=1 Tax=Liparis tanakae TaxID=230148 RepID=A0A4Z2HQ21_9TELE|nr:hypothetical protein EYF80_022135 [Liparis tanakae]
MSAMDTPFGPKGRVTLTSKDDTAGYVDTELGYDNNTSSMLRHYRAFTALHENKEETGASPSHDRDIKGSVGPGTPDCSISERRVDKTPNPPIVQLEENAKTLLNMNERNTTADLKPLMNHLRSTALTFSSSHSSSAQHVVRLRDPNFPATDTPVLRCLSLLSD